jgi:hypothetical protein
MHYSRFSFFFNAVRSLLAIFLFSQDLADPFHSSLKFLEVVDRLDCGAAKLFSQNASIKLKINRQDQTLLAWAFLPLKAGSFFARSRNYK